MGKKIDYEKVIEKIIEICERDKFIPQSKEIIEMKLLSDLKALTKYMKNKGYEEWKDYFRDLGFSSSKYHKEDFKFGNKYIKGNKLSVDNIVILFNEFKDIYNKFPTSEDCNSNKYNLPRWDNVTTILANNNILLNDFYKSIGKYNHYKSQPKEYNKKVELYKKVSNELGHSLTNKELVNNIYGLPSSRYFVKHCINKKVVNFNQFIEWCGFVPYYEVSKEKAIECILNKQQQLKRPLVGSDFKSSRFNDISIHIINNIWGNFNNMKRELGLEIVRESMKDLSRDIEQLKIDIYNLCNLIYKTENRKIITQDDIENSNKTMSYSTYSKFFKNDLDISLRDYIKSLGFELLKSGTGLVHYYNDGEITSSQFEYTFSNYIKSKGFCFNHDYFRNVRYNTFIDSYIGLLDCDYVINYKNKLIYIEIAGILRDYKAWYYENRPLNSKSKEKYRLKLKQKEQMLIESGLEYYILFPSDLNENTYNKIFK